MTGPEALAIDATAKEDRHWPFRKMAAKAPTSRHSNARIILILPAEGKDRATSCLFHLQSISRLVVPKVSGVSELVIE